MICNCPICGTLMSHKEQGIESKCICPACQHTCDICLGSGKMMQKGGAVPMDIWLKYEAGEDAK
ncbi:MAG: hypothetical protein ACLUR9_09335 [Christensenellales bacterium]